MLSVDESDSINDDSENDGSDSRSDVTCNFNFRFDDSVGCIDVSVGRVDDFVGRVQGVGSRIFFR